jgi:hypothetical protein
VFLGVVVLDGTEKGKKFLQMVFFKQQEGEFMCAYIP